jgi:hypothetical protein
MKIGPRSDSVDSLSAGPGKTGEKIMRYAFHGKRRGTHEPLDGYIDASSAIDAIDQLADEGIIGVYSVRQITPRPKRSLILQGDFETAVEEESGPNAAPTADVILTQLVNKMTSLVGEVEKMLARPAAPNYPTRNRISETKQLSRITEQKGSVLQDIFQSNLDLRRSIAQTASTPTAATSQPPVIPNRELAVSTATAA